MNIHIIDNLFETLNKYEKVIKYQYEPQIPQSEMGIQRNTYFPELKKDFIDEITAYGFSPYIHQTSDLQQQLLKQIKYKKKSFNYGLNNYIKRKTHYKRPSLLTKNLIQNYPKAKSVKNSKGISFASNLIQAWKVKSNKSSFVKEIQSKCKLKKKVNDSLTDNSNMSNSSSLRTLSRVFMTGYTPRNTNETASKVHHPLRLIIEPKAIMNSQKNIHRTIAMPINASPIEKHSPIDKQKAMNENDAFKTPKSLHVSSSYKTKLLLSANSNLKLNDIDSLKLNLFKSRKESIDRERFNAEKHPGSIFNRLQLIRNSSNYKEFKVNKNTNND